jgi:hypothetical protein
MARSRTRTLTIEKLQARFTNWRRKRQGRSAIPDEMWTAASELARRDGVNRIATAFAPGWRKAETTHGGGAYHPENRAPRICRVDRATDQRQDRIHDRIGRPSRTTADSL